MCEKIKGHTLMEFLLGISLSLVVLSGLFTIYLATQKIHRIQSALINIQDNSRWVLSTIQSDLTSRGYTEMSRYRLDHQTNRLYREDNHGHFQLLSEGVVNMNIVYDRQDLKNISGVSIAFDLTDFGITQKEYLYVAL
jgi:Tfp pilus assembly protein PilW